VEMLAQFRGFSAALSAAVVGKQGQGKKAERSAPSRLTSKATIARLCMMLVGRGQPAVDFPPPSENRRHGRPPG
jgi:hypothetical protein